MPDQLRRAVSAVLALALALAVLGSPLLADDAASASPSAAVPGITGTAVVGATLTAAQIGWTKRYRRVTYEWRLDGRPAFGATTRRWVVPRRALGKRVTVRVTGFDGAHHTRSRVSRPVGPVRTRGTAPGVTAGSSASAPASPALGTPVADPARTPVAPGSDPGPRIPAPVIAPAGASSPAPSVQPTTVATPAVRVRTITTDIAADTALTTADADVYVIGQGVMDRVVVQQGATLTVGAGVTLRMVGALAVRGTLDVEGSSDGPVVITSIQDRAHGGDVDPTGRWKNVHPAVSVTAEGTGSLRARWLQLLGQFTTCGALDVADSQLSGGIRSPYPRKPVPDACGFAGDDVTIRRSALGTPAWPGPTTLTRRGSVTVADGTVDGTLTVDSWWNTATIAVTGNTVRTQGWDSWNQRWTTTAAAGIAVSTGAGRAGTPNITVIGNTVTGTPFHAISLNGGFGDDTVHDNRATGWRNHVYAVDTYGDGQPTVAGTLTVPLDGQSTGISTLAVPQGQRLVVRSGDAVGMDGRGSATIDVAGAIDIRGTTERRVAVTGTATGGLLLNVRAGGSATIDYADLTRIFKIRSAGTLVVDHTAVRDPLAPSCGAPTDDTPQCDDHVAGTFIITGGTAAITADFTGGVGRLLDVASGIVTLRGSATGTPPGAYLVRACDWDSGTCAVDARGFDWSAGAAGPFVDSVSADGAATPNRACGTTLVWPWKDAVANGYRSAFSIGDCYGAPWDPASKIQAAQRRSAERLSPYQAACSATQDSAYRDACAVVATYDRCLAGAKEIIRSQTTWPVIADAQDAGEYAAANAADYLKDLGGTAGAVAGAASAGFQVLDVVRQLHAVGSAYSTCAP